MLEQTRSIAEEASLEPQESMRTDWLTIARRLLLSFAFLALLLVIVGGAGLVALQFAARSFEVVAGDVLVEQQTVGDLRALAWELLSEVREYALLGEEDTREEIGQTLNDLDAGLQAYSAAGSEFEEEEEVQSDQQMLRRLEASVSDLRVVVEETIALVESGAGPESLAQAGQDLETAENMLESALAEIEAALAEETQQSLGMVRPITGQWVSLGMVGLIVVALVLISVILYRLTRSIVRPVEALGATAQRFAAGNLEQRATILHWDEIGLLAQTFNSMAAQLAGLIQSLEQRTRQLERRTRYLEATADVAREAASELNIEDLLFRSVELMTRRFELYRMAVFLLDPSGEWAVLRAATGRGGQQLLQGGFRFKVSGEGIVAHTLRTGKPYLVADVRDDPAYLEIPEMADTRSELSLPLQARGKILGALSVQSPEPGALSDEHLTVMQTLADQMALAINNAQLFQQAQESLEAERRAYGELSRQAWLEIARAQPDLAVLRDEQGISSVSAWLDAEFEQALQSGQSAVSSDGGTNLAVPIRVRGQVIGAIDAHKPAGSGGWTPEQIALLETLSEQVGDALEDARLYQEIQRRAAHDRMMTEVTGRMRESLEIETVLQTAVREMREALGIAEVEVQLEAPEP